MKKIILDTNFLLIPVEFKVDIFSEIERIMQEEYELYIIDKTLEELEKIKIEQKSKYKLAARIATELIKKNSVKTIKTENDDYVDDQILKIAKNGYIVATQDKKLKKELKNLNISRIVLRQKKYLKMV